MTVPRKPAPAQPFRLPHGGAIDRSQPLRFRFDGCDHDGFAGDTLASALLANGVHLVGRSFKYHRPRGIVAAGAEEPNALVQLDTGARTEPNVRATTIELYDGLVAASQNRWPSLRLDAGALASAVSRLLPAGFYYKTFMWPASPRGWRFYEHWIRRAAGLGVGASASDPGRYAHRHAHCDVLVVGAGPAGLAAARAAAASGARVIVCDEEREPGGRLRGVAGASVDGTSAPAWLAAVGRELAAHPQVTMLARTTAFGYYDHNLVGLVERCPGAASEHLRERVWHVRARRVVLATGAHERPIAYAGNDLPGTLLAGAARAYVERFAVRPGRRAVVFTNNDTAHAAALVLHAAGVEIAAIVDVRPDTALVGHWPGQARAARLPILAGSVVEQARGRLHVRGVDVASRDSGARCAITCDLVCVSGGWNPAVHLHSQARGTLRYDDALATFVPAAAAQAVASAGAANGCDGLAAALAEGHAAGLAAAAALDLVAVTPPPAPAATVATTGPLEACWSIPARSRGAPSFVDWQNDVTTADVALAVREGYTSVEHLKRYTTLGMGTDQGKTANVVGLALLAQLLNRPVQSIGTTTFRPPYTPVTLGAVAGHEAGPFLEPTRRSALHDWHAAHGARFVTAGLWLRPHSYPRPGETPDDAANREARNVRTNAGIVDVSTLGKIELQGRDVATLLDRVYVNRFDNLAVGRCRYGLMLRDDGIVQDDGTVSRIAPTHYLVTTTTVNAVRVMQQLEYLIQVEWPELDVYATSVTEQWCAAALSGPKSRAILARIVDIDVASAAVPFLAITRCTVNTPAGAVPARLLRVSYSGELAFELHVPADQGPAMWEAVLAAGEDLGIMAYGTEAMSTLRIEKGHIVVGAEADGRTTADDLGMGKLVNAGKWCIGKPLLSREALVAPDRWQLVGLTADEPAVPIPRGAKLVADPDRAAPNPMLGHVTSWCWSPNLDAWIALALLDNGRARHGTTLWAVSPLADARVRVRVGPPAFVDPDGERLRG